MTLMEEQRQTEKRLPDWIYWSEKEEEFTSHHLNREKVSSAKFTPVCGDEGGGCGGCDSVPVRHLSSLDACSVLAGLRGASPLITAHTRLITGINPEWLP